MISISIIIISLVIASMMLLANRGNLYKVVNEGRFNQSREFLVSSWVKPILVVVIGLITALIQPYQVNKVDAGNVGIAVNLTGDSRGVAKYTYKNGWTVINTWTTALYEFPTYQQHIEYDSVTVITKGGFSATIKPTFNYALKPNNVGDMFQQLRLGIDEIEKGWLQTAIIGSVNDVANRWTVDDIFNKREEFESAIVTECNKRVSKWFAVSQLRTNIVPPKALRDAIIAKTKAIQDAQTKMQQALVAEANGRKMIAEARADSAQAVIKASGLAQADVIEARATAEVMKLKQAQLSALYVEFLKAQKWDGKLPNTILGNSTPMINIK